MELLLLLPLLIGYGVYEYFQPSTDDEDDSGTDSGTPSPNSATEEVIEGSGDAETLSGLSGDDFILAGANADTVAGGLDDDVLLGELGADKLFGGQGFDTILGGAGKDELYGGTGKDVLIGGAGNDSMEGGDGDDFLTGSSGADTLEGGRGNDFLNTLESGNPSLFKVTSDFPVTTAAYVQDTYGAGVDADALTRLTEGFNSADTADRADDVVFAGSGNDSIVADYSDTVTGGAGDDLIEVVSNGANEAVTINDLDPADDRLIVYVPAGTNAAISYVDGATRADGVSVVVNGDVVAVLKGLLAAEVPSGTVRVAFTSA